MRQAECPRGIVHVHTSFSCDGLLPPGEVARICRKRGLAFAALADHAEDVNDDTMAMLVRECEHYSRDGFVLVPGIEHRFQPGIHILALGQRRLAHVQSPTEMFSALAAEGCVLVAAHCAADGDLSDSLLEMLAAVEIWNVSRDTRFLPTSRSFAAYRWWAAAHPNLYAIGGLDMHAGNEWGCEVVLDPHCEPTYGAVLSGLRQGQFVTRGSFLSFGSRPTGAMRGFAFAAGDALASARNVRNRVLCRG